MHVEGGLKLTVFTVLAVQRKKAYVGRFAYLNDIFSDPASVTLGKDPCYIRSFLLDGILNVLLLTLKKLGRIVIASAVAVIQIDKHDLMSALAQCARNACAACYGNIAFV